jgi:hypothetical protein
MDSDASGWLIFTMEVVGVLVLAAGLIYGIMMWRRRSRDPAVEAARDAAIRRLYKSDPGPEEKN